MTAVERVRVQPHRALRRVGARPSVIHAAVWEPVDAPAGPYPFRAGWRTACGELLVDSDRGTLEEVPVAVALAPGAPVCKRCARVGDSVAS